MTNVYNLTARRRARREARYGSPYAPGEIPGRGFPIELAGEILAYLPAEFPLAALAPIRDFEDEIGGILYGAFQVFTRRQGLSEPVEGETPEQKAARETEENSDLIKAIIGAISDRADLPKRAVNAFLDVCRNLFGQDGYDKLCTAGITAQDIPDLGAWAWQKWQASPGESSTSSGGAGTAGETSQATSSGTSGSTPDGSGFLQATQTSSEPTG